jgi:hypothetical protein
MKKTFIKSLIFGLILITGFSSVSAQESTTLYFMKGMPQSNLQNPALHNDSSAVVIGLPGLSGAYFDASSGFAINDLIHKGTGILADSLVLDLDNFHNALKATNSIEQNFSIPLFYLGIRSKKSFFSLGISEKENARFSFDKNLVTFIKDGNAPYMGQNFDLGNIGMDAFEYTEIALGYSNELIKNKLTVGVRAKALMGHFAIQTERMDLKVQTAPDGSYLNLSSDMKINMAAPVTVEYDTDGYFSGMNGDNIKPKDVMLQKGNSGMAFDLGAVYKLTPKITLTGSIVDIGKISFKNDVITLNHVSSYKWEGIDFSHSIGDTTAIGYVKPSDLADTEMKKIENSFKPKRSEFGSKAFDMSLPMKIYLGGTYQINNKFNIGLLDRLYKNGNFNQNTLTLSANAMFGNAFSLTGSYSMIGNSYNNLGIGMAIRLGFMQLYLVSDNVLALNDPAKAEFVNLRLGMNFLFGRKHTVVAVVE